jgi:flagellar motility protein MotE (MotC chaperone)
MFEKMVKNKDGNEKRVVADSQAELDAQVKAVQNEAAPASPNIDNPAHGNMTQAEFDARDGKRNELNDAEAVPTSDESKELSRKLADVDSKDERYKVMQADADKKVPENSPMRQENVGTGTTPASGKDTADDKSQSSDKKAVDSNKKS